MKRKLPCTISYQILPSNTTGYLIIRLYQNGEQVISRHMNEGLEAARTYVKQSWRWLLCNKHNTPKFN